MSFYSSDSYRCSEEIVLERIHFWREGGSGAFLTSECPLYRLKASRARFWAEKKLRNSAQFLQRIFGHVGEAIDPSTLPPLPLRGYPYAVSYIHGYFTVGLFIYMLEVRGAMFNPQIFSPAADCEVENKIQRTG